MISISDVMLFWLAYNVKQLFIYYSDLLLSIFYSCFINCNICFRCSVLRFVVKSSPGIFDGMSVIFNEMYPASMNLPRRCFQFYIVSRQIWM